MPVAKLIHIYLQLPNASSSLQNKLVHYGTLCKAIVHQNGPSNVSLYTYEFIALSVKKSQKCTYTHTHIYIYVGMACKLHVVVHCGCKQWYIAAHI